MNARLTRLPQLIAAVLTAAAIKLFYSTANVDSLLWILAPTTALVRLITGVGFSFESGAGYMSDDRSFLIAAPCSGVNFFIAGFSMLAIAHLWRREKVGWLFLPFCLAVAYLATILANTARISTALEIRRMDPEVIWLNPDQLHRFEGIVVYFGFLVLLYFANEKIADRHQSENRRRSRHPWIFPLAIYYMATLCIPVANAAFSSGSIHREFYEHAAFVIVVPLVMLVIVAGARLIISMSRDLTVNELR